MIRSQGHDDSLPGRGGHLAYPVDMLEQPILDEELGDGPDRGAEELCEEDGPRGNVHVVRDLLILDEC